LAVLWAKEEETVHTRKALEILGSAEERMKTAEGRLRAFIERPDRYNNIHRKRGQRTNACSTTSG
jgi:hypothetical protein